MKYFRLYELQNQYPNINNYFRENTISSVDSLYNHGDAVLRGIFPQNERRFPLSNIAFITPIANTSMRFILKVKKSADDEFPRYFTSFNYFAELEQSILSSNPYFLNLSLLDINIVEFDLTDSIIAFKNQLEAESSRNVLMFKNNFLKIIDETSKDAKTTTYGSDPTGVVRDNNTSSTEFINQEPIVRRRLLVQPNDNVEVGGGQTNLRTAVAQFDLVNSSNDIVSERINSPRSPRRGDRGNTGVAGRLLSQNEIAASIQTTEDFNGQIPTQPDVVVGRRIYTAPIEEPNPNTEEKPKSEVEKMVEEVIENPYLDLVGDLNDSFTTQWKMYVDYRDLCYYLSWCLSSPSLDSIENNGVLTANELSKFEFTNKTNDTEKVDNPDPNTGDNPIPPPTGKYFEYDIVRLTIPATLDQSSMMFKNQAGQMQEIKTDKYGLVGTFCCEENSWSGNHYIYQKTQKGPCPQIYSGGTTGGGNSDPRGYGYGRDYDNRLGSIDFINQENDYRNIQQ